MIIIEGHRIPGGDSEDGLRPLTLDDCRNYREGILSRLMDAETLIGILADEIKRLNDETEYLRDFKETMADDFQRVVNNDCYPDARHCSCVFHLRAEIERLKANQPFVLDGLAEAEVDLEPDEMKF